MVDDRQVPAPPPAPDAVHVAVRADAVERLPRALYGIAHLASSSLDMHAVLAEMHGLVGELMAAESLFVVLLDADRAHFRFLYFADSHERRPPPVNQPMAIADYPNSATAALMARGRPVYGSVDRVAAELGVPFPDVQGPLASDWLGVPMFDASTREDGIVCGALVVQSYDASARFGEQERDLLVFVAQLVQSLLERRSLQQRLEQRVEERTLALRDEIAERRRAEHLQQVLYRIADLSASPIALSDFFAAVHASVDELLNAKNFYIALLDDDGEGLWFPYQVDETGDTYVPRRLRRGLTEYVMRLGKPVLIDLATANRLASEGEIEHIGSDSVCWLGVPLRPGERTVGAVVVQSYTEGIVYSQADQDLLSFVSVHIANGLERKQGQDALRRNVGELKETLQRLRDTQRDLVNAEKMAALGQLVAGVAHEVNTPLGIAITATSGLAQETHTLLKTFEGGQLQRSQLEAHFTFSDEALRLLGRNLQRAAELIRTFKHVAVDRSSDGRRQFHLNEFIAELLPSLALLWKHRPVQLQVVCEPDLKLDSFPGALGQVLTNLVQNALLHAFPGDRPGQMKLLACADGDARVRIEFCDDGIGIPAEHLPRIFEPFFTTRRGHGGTGLGLQIVFNLISEKLGGSVQAFSDAAAGTRFVLNLPRLAPGE
ncbi:MAG: sensor histidine kinase [Pseudomarimonas sp.]